MNDRLFEPGSRGPRIAIVVGEASGDLLGSQLILALKARLPGAQFSGIAGPKMMAAGARSVVPMESLAVRGYLEVLKHLPRLIGIRRRLKKAILAERPDLVIGVDAPDFNLGLEAAAKAAGIPTVHYVGPSVWAWRPERLKKIGAAVSHILLLFPFEEEIYREAKIPATYVGHPLADLMPVVPDQAALREQLDISSGGPVFALLPGSRQNELEMLGALFVETAKRLYERFPDATFLVPFITRETRQYFESEMWRQGAQELPFRLLFGHAHEAMQAADAILVASGTAALEAMLAKRPTVVTYRITDFTYRMVKRKLRLPYVSLPNVLEGRFVLPELIQHEATAENISQALANLVLDKRLASKLAACFTEHHEALRCNAADRAAEAVIRLLGARAWA
ncbi:lipid-A-disaccharide synthase [Jeongeupia sp. HS-3]|uniref:lipid-A-disaccharide synthase n=1 Tax=Jeongeupia sp. HS-3 TaxID=1009682 RepID=UPI0018A43175|nr:lipid-A-disaccharide synthase [Jeongeupia sp. HS-3]BCL75188.1 lipid-A-disaccharide synthase [Jeongeupia sp. HS-3]